MIWRRLTEVIGMAQGGSLRAVLSSLFGRDVAAEGGDPAARLGTAFTAAVVALAAKMAQADGVVVDAEREAFRRLFPVRPEAEYGVMRLFELARQDIAGYESYARQIAANLEREPALKRGILESLFHIAAADGVLHPGEAVFLERVTEIFGYTKAEYRAIRAMFVADADDPYVILGVPHEISDRDLRLAYHRLVRDNHPDALTGRGVPSEFVTVADRKLAAINAAYDAIAKERGL